MVNVQKFNEAIATRGIRKDYLASLLGISRQSLSSKINNKTEFKAQEAKLLKDRMCLSDTEFVEIFFASECGCEPQCEVANG